MITKRDEGFRRRPDTPRRVRNGVRLRTKDETPEFRWPAGPWLTRMLGQVDSVACEEGLEFARKGQTAVLDVEPARIRAEVQDIEPRPHEIVIEFAPISREDWTRVVNSMAKEARYTAKLVSGEVSEEIAEPFAAAGITLLPEPDAVTVKCGCGVDGCRHLATVAYLVAERMEQDPLLILTLRGLFGPRFLERLQEARLLATSGVSRAHPIPPSAAAIRDQSSEEEDVANFWTPGPGREDFLRTRRLEHHPHALLRRLGSAPLEGRFPLVGLLASIYDTVADSARERLAMLDAEVVDAPPPPDDEGDEDGDV